MINVAISICCLLFLLIIMVVYFSKKRINNVDNRIFSFMIITNLVGILIDIVGYFSFNLYGVDFILNKCIAKLYLVYFLLYGFCLFSYIFNVTFRNIEKYIKKMLLISLGVSFVIFLLPISMKKNLNSAFSYGPSVNFAYFIGFLLIISMFVFLACGRKKIGIKKYIPLLGFAVLTMLAVVVQKINPVLTLLLLSNTMVTFLMYFTIENPDMQMVEQLAKAKDDADRANRAKTDFLSSMSHEIRTPLNAIVGFSDCIVNSDNLSDAKENARDIVNASKTLLEIVNGILDISKIESGKLELVNVSYDARFTFKELATMITPKAEEKGLKFSFYLAPDIPPVLYGDVNNVKKIITNLLSNAVKYTDKGFIRYEITCVNEGDTSRLMISVEDSGRGIKKDAVDKLFSKFQRLDEDKNSTIEGTGLGLAITKQLVDLMNGQIAVHTVYGTGSKFTVMIPQKISDEVIKVEEPEEEKKVVKKVVTLKEAKILLVDDNNLNLKVASKLLEREGATNITCVNSGFDCLDKISAGEKFDLIFMDDMMPKMSGRETFLKLREIPGFVTPVIALTANAISGAKEEYLELGFNEYLAKPIEKEELVRVLSSVLKPKEDEYSNVTVVENEELEKGAPSKEEYLRSNGVMIDKALETLGDMNVYEVTLKDFLQSIDARWENVKKYKESGDLEKYSSELRSIKSDCKYLGFTKLANTCFLHELKSKDGDKEYITKHFVDLEDAYNVALKIMKGV